MCRDLSRFVRFKIAQLVCSLIRGFSGLRVGRRHRSSLSKKKENTKRDVLPRSMEEEE